MLAIPNVTAAPPSLPPTCPNDGGLRCATETLTDGNFVYVFLEYDYSIRVMIYDWCWGELLSDVVVWKSSGEVTCNPYILYYDYLCNYNIHLLQP